MSLDSSRAAGATVAGLAAPGAAAAVAATATTVATAAITCEVLLFRLGEIGMFSSLR